MRKEEKNELLVRKGIEYSGMDVASHLERNYMPASLDTFGGSMRNTAKNSIFLLLLFLLSGPFPSLAESEWKFYGKISIEKVCVDTYDRKWFVTKDSLCVLDGTGWRSFSEVDLGFPVNSILAIEAASDGSIWLGTSENGAARYNGTSWQPYTVGNSGLGAVGVNNIAFDNTGGVWFLTTNQCVNLIHGIWTVFYKKIHETWESWINCLVVDREGHSFFGRMGGGIQIQDPGLHYFTTYSGLVGGAVRDIAVMPDDRIVIGADGGISILDTSTWKCKSLSGYCAELVRIDKNEAIWFANKDGFYFYDGQGITEFPNLMTPIGTNDKIYDNRINDIEIDQEGTIWFATWRGIFSFSGRFAQITLPKPNQGGSPACSAGSALKIPWIARLVKNVRLEYSVNGGETWNLITSSARAESQEFAWTVPFGIVPAGYVSIPVKLRISAAEDKSVNHTTEILVETPGFRESLTEISSEELLWPQAMAESADGAKWVATFMGGMLRYDGVTWERFTEINSGLVNDSIYGGCTVDSRGNLWAATYRGLSRYDGSEWKSWFAGKEVKAVGAGGNAAWAVSTDSLGLGLFRFSVDDPVPERVADWKEWFTFGVSPLGELWTWQYGEEDGVWDSRLKRYDGFQWRRYSVESEYKFLKMDDFTWDAEGRIWGTIANRSAIFSFDGYTWKYYFLNDNKELYEKFHSIAFDRNGVLWSLLNSELYTFDGTRWKPFDRSHGWPVDRFNRISRIFIDRNDVKWLLCGSRLFRFDDHLVSVEEQQVELLKFAILGNHPNPFNPSTAITFSLPASGRATLSVYSITGQKVRELVSGQFSAGTHTVVWDGKDTGGHAVASGVYFSRLEAHGRAETCKMLLMR